MLRRSFYSDIASNITKKRRDANYWQMFMLHFPTLYLSWLIMIIVTVLHRILTIISVLEYASIIIARSLNQLCHARNAICFSLACLILDTKDSKNQYADEEIMMGSALKIRNEHNYHISMQKKSFIPSDFRKINNCYSWFHIKIPDLLPLRIPNLDTSSINQRERCNKNVYATYRHRNLHIYFVVNIQYLM